MADRNPTDRAAHDPLSPAGEDRKTESAVLAFLLEEHPVHFALGELSLALNGEPPSFPDEDDVARAVRELVGAGLLHRFDRFVVPSRAALYFDRLEMD